MAEYEPTFGDYLDLRHNFMELVKDYLLLYQMNGVQSIVDLYIDTSEKAEEALQSAKDLIVQVDRIDALAATDHAALGDVWPEVNNILEDYSFHHVEVKGGVVHGVHEWFKPLWVAAKALGLDVGKIEEEVARQMGRPRGTGSYPTKESFNTAHQEAISRLRKRGDFNPSQEKIAEEMVSMELN